MTKEIDIVWPFSVPPVYTGNWDNSDWLNYIRSFRPTDKEELARIRRELETARAHQLGDDIIEHLYYQEQVIIKRLGEK